MSRIACNSTILTMPIEDEAGQPLFSVEVFIDYVQEVDCSYGEDADGQRGTTTVAYYITDKYMAAVDLLKLNSAQVEDVLARAEQKFYRTPKHFE